MLLDSVTRGLRLVRRFDGRDTRGQFWPYAGAVVVVVLGVGFVFQLGVLVSSFVTALDPSSSVVPIAFLASTAVGVLAAVSLLAAAVTRRLHDRGYRGWWALAPLTFLLTGFALMTPMFVSPDEPPSLALFMTTFATVLLYFAALGLLVLQLALPSRSSELSDSSAPG